MTRGWRALGLFWVVVLASLGAGAAALQVLGPPPTMAANTTLPAVEGAPAPPARPVLAAASPAPVAVAPTAPITDIAARIAPPAPPEADDGRPRIAILLVGIGLSENESRQAMTTLPGAISLGISPYGAAPAAMAEAGRVAGHEDFLSLPLEPAQFPLNDAGPHALLTGATAARNDANLDWALSRYPGYIGATSALDGLRGERFAADTSLYVPLLDIIAGRGLLWVDARPGARLPPDTVGRPVDMVLDEPPDRASIEKALAALEARARDGGAAIGLAGPPRPVLIERLAAWSATLSNRGLHLVAVSTLLPHPAPRPQIVSQHPTEK